MRHCRMARRREADRWEFSHQQRQRYLDIGHTGWISPGTAGMRGFFRRGAAMIAR